MKKLFALGLALVMALTTLTACGGTTAGVKVININLTEEEYAFGVDPKQPELLAATNTFIQKIKNDGTLEAIFDKYFSGGTPTPITSAQLDETKDQLVVATNAEFAPFEYMEGNTFYGVDMEIASLLAQELGKELVIVHMDFDAVCLQVNLQQCDIAMAGLTVSPDREELVTFTDSYYNASQQLIVAADNTEFDACTTAADVEKILNAKDANTKVGVQKGTTGQLYSEGDADWGFAGFPVTTVPYGNGSLAVQDLLNGGVDYVIIDSAPATYIVDAINAMQ